MKHVLLASTALGLLASPALHAQDAARADEEIIVTGRRLEESIPLDLRQFGNRVEIITSEQLQLGGFTDVGQTLQMEVPGLYLAPKNGAFDYMDCSLQGSRCQDILWLIDGVRINNRLYNTTGPLDTVPAHMIERIEVLYGGQGIFYGTQSIAGVVNIVTKSFKNEPAGNVGLGFDANEGTHLNADYAAAFGEHQVVLYASQDEADGFQPFSDADYQPSGTNRERGYEVTTAGAKYRYAFSADSQVTLHYHHTTSKVENAAPSNTALAFNDRDEDLLTAKWDYAAGDNVDLFVKAYYHWWDTYWTEIENELDASGNLTGDLIIGSDREFWGYEDYGVTAMARIRSGTGLEYAFGYDRQQFHGRDEVLLIADRTEHVDAYFGQIRTSEGLLGNTRLALGLRHNRPSGEGAITIGNISGRHDFSENLYVRGNLGTSFRLPDAFQLFGNDPCCALGNPDLEGEEGRNLNVAFGGASGLGSGLNWEFIVFKREIDNLIGTAGGIHVNTENTVEFEGWEAYLAVGLTPALRATFSYVDTTANEDGSSEQIAEIPETMLKAALTYRPEAMPLELGLSVINIGDVYDSVSGGIGRIEHGNYQVFDVNAAYRFGSDDQQRIGLRLENAFDEEYATSLGRAFVDADGSSYAYENLGTPRTVHLTYDYSF